MDCSRIVGGVSVGMVVETLWRLCEDVCSDSSLAYSVLFTFVIWDER